MFIVLLHSLQCLRFTKFGLKILGSTNVFLPRIFV